MNAPLAYNEAGHPLLVVMDFPRHLHIPKECQAWRKVEPSVGPKTFDMTDAEDTHEAFFNSNGRESMLKKGARKRFRRGMSDLVSDGMTR